jgi:hypothetical protein
MDDDQGQNTDLLDAPDLNEAGPSIGDRASDIGHGLKSSAQSAKDVIGSAKGGAGDGIGSALKNGLGSAGGAGSSTSNPLSGLASAGKSMDGMKGAGGNTPNMFKGLENNSNPAGKNDTSGDKENPSASDFSKKANKKSGTELAGQAVNDAVQTGKEVKHAAAAIGSLGADALDDAELAKDVAKAAAHPIKTAKRYGRVAIYLMGFFFIQFIMIMAIVGALFFGIYKVYLASMEVAQNPLRLATELRVNTEMASWLIDAVGSLAYERDLEKQHQSGIAVAANRPPNTPEISTNPETEKMFEAWGQADLATRFFDDYHARFEQIEGTSGSSVNDWELVVNNNNFGPISSTRSQAFIGIFAEETTHWNDIYTREALQGVAETEFSTPSFVLELPDSERDLSKSRQNTTTQLIDSTAQPVAERSGDYYDCLIQGESFCDSLGLGSTGSSDNNPTAESRGWIASIIDGVLGFREEAKAKALASKVGQDNLGEYALSASDQITPETSTYSTKNALSANIRTGSSDTVLSSISRDPDNPEAPDTDVLLDLYDRFQTATENGNYARVNYDRESHQSVALSENYFIAGGQLLNNEMGLLDSWSLSENLSILEESSIFRAAVIGNPIGLFAQSESEDRGIRGCQRIFNDLNPVGEVSENIDREVLDNSCFRRSLIPNGAEFQEDKSINRIYSILEGRNREVDQSSGQYAKLVGDAFPKLQQYANDEIRTSPVATESISISTDLSPEFDGYTNQVYGMSKVGAEIDGEAIDSMYTAAEALWSKVNIDDRYGMGGQYLTDDEFAEIQRYSQKMEREKMSFKPLGERLFAIKDPGSLAGKLAMLTPTNKEGGIKRTLALLSPSNLSSAVASRMISPTLAQSTVPVNPLHAVRTGIPLSHPSNRMGGEQLWEEFNCDAGGPTQESAQPEGVPFTLPVTSNPCQRESVISRITTCYFDADDSCSFDDASTGLPGAISDDSSSTPCYPGSDDLGVRDDAYTEGRQIRIRLCAVNGMTSSSEESQAGGVPNANGRALTSSISSEAWVKLVALAQQQGVPLNASSTFRTMEHQIRLCQGNSQCSSGYNPSTNTCSQGSNTAVACPGRSNHQSGTAMDIAEAGAGNGASSGRTCDNPQTVGTATYAFLAANARTFGIKNYANESWHWGTNESC